MKDGHSVEEVSKATDMTTYTDTHTHTLYLLSPLDHGCLPADLFVAVKLDKEVKIR